MLIFKSQKIIEKIENRKNNRKRTAIIRHQKNFNYRKKIESIGPGHYRIALSLRINYRKMSSMRLPSLVFRAR